MKKVFFLSFLCISLLAPIMATAKDLDTIKPSSPISSSESKTIRSPEPSKTTPIISGTWSGTIHGNSVDFKITLDITQKGNSIEGTLTNLGKGGVSKHYLRGQFDLAQEQFLCKDIGVDKIEGGENWFPLPVEQYALNLVEGGNKLVGSCHQSGSTDTLWISVSKQPHASSIESTNLQSSQYPLSEPIKMDKISDQSIASKTNEQTNNISGKSTTPSISGTWSGLAHGNDPLFKFILELQQQGDAISGMCTTESKFGTSKRYISGHYDTSAGTFVCKDLGFIYNSPAKGCRYCLVDQYNLQLTDDGKRLSGTYQSITCHDKASFSLASSVPGQTMPNISDIPTSSIGEDNLGPTGKVTPDVAAYMTNIEKSIKKHWHPPHSSSTKKVLMRFYINKDGSVSDLNFDPSPEQSIDDTVQAAFDAIKAAAPFPPPPQCVLEAASVNGGEQVPIRFAFDFKHRRTSSVLPLLPLVLLGRGFIYYSAPIP